MLNHSCRPNLYVTYRSDGIAEVCLRSHVQAGEELCISYPASTADALGFPGMPFGLRKARQSTLLQNYGFTCMCSLCTEGAPGIESGNCECGAELRPGFLNALTNQSAGGETVACSSCGQSNTTKSCTHGESECNTVQRLITMWNRCRQGSLHDTGGSKIHARMAAKVLSSSKMTGLHSAHLARFDLNALTLHVIDTRIDAQRVSTGSEQHDLLRQGIDVCNQMLAATALWTNDEDLMWIPILQHWVTFTELLHDGNEEPESTLEAHQQRLMSLQELYPCYTQ